MSTKKYLSLVKFSHTLFALPFSFIGFFHGLAFKNSEFNWYKLLLVLICMVTARNAAMAFNRYLDRDIDAKNSRTSTRELPAGMLRANAVMLFVILNCIGFVLAAGFINPLCLMLSPIALMVILGYSYTKRFTALCHFVLGLGLALAPIGAFLAITGMFDSTIIFLAIGILLWVSGFDIIYALQDKVFDESNKLRSMPVVLGVAGSRKLSFTLHLFSILAFSLYIWLIHVEYPIFGPISYLGLLVFIALVLYQHSLFNPNNLSKINADFFFTNGIGSLILGLSVVVDYLF